MVGNVLRILAFYSLIGGRRLAPILFGGLLITSPVMFDFFVPLLVREIIDELAGAGKLNLEIIYLLAGVYACSFVLTYVGEQLYLRGKFKAAADLRNRIFSHSFFFPWQKLKQKGSAYYATLINNQVNDAFIVLDYGYIRNIVVLIRMIVILAVVLTWSRAFFVLFLLNVVIVGAYSGIIGRATHHHYARGYELIRQAAAYIVETFENLHEVLAGEARVKRCGRHEQMSNEITDVALRAERIRARLDRVMVDLPEYLSRVLLLLYGGFLVVNGRMTIGTLWALWVYFSYVTEPLYLFRELARIAVQAAANLEAILGYFAEAEQSRKAFANSKLVPAPEAPVYSVDNVSFGFDPAKPILKQVTFEVSRGEIVAIVGLSGEGKSTLLNILLGLEQGYEGKIRLLGNDLRGVFPGAVFEHVGYYSQTVGIFNDTLENNIVLGRPLDPRRLEEVIAELELGHLRGRLLGEGGSFISGGEKQRVQLARLFYGGKKIVVIDEPLTNLDLISERSLLAKLERYITVRSGIIISHKPNVLRLAKRAILLKDGQVVATGTLRELVARDSVCREIIRSYLSSAHEVRVEVGETGSDNPFTQT